MPSDIASAFWAQVEIGEDNQCWPWVGAKTSLGYGRPMINGKRCMAHRLALEFATGDSGDGLFALHSCDNPNCVNPKHLRWGTQSDNIQDRVKRGRNGAARGEANGSAKLDADKVLAIREDKRTTREIAAEYGVSQILVSKIKRRIVWSHIDGMDTAKAGKAPMSAMQPHAQKQG